MKNISKGYFNFIFLNLNGTIFLKFYKYVHTFFQV